MIVILIGIIALIMIILLSEKMLNSKKNFSEIMYLLLWYVGFPIAIFIIIYGIFTPTKMGEWKVEKEAIAPTLVTSEEDKFFNGYTYQYIIPERFSSKPKILNYTTETLLEDVPILVKCERKGKPTIWTLGLGVTETEYVFYFNNDTIKYVPIETIK